MLLIATHSKQSKHTTQTIQLYRNISSQDLSKLVLFKDIYHLILHAGFINVAYARQTYNSIFSIGLQAIMNPQDAIDRADDRRPQRKASNLDQDVQKVICM